MKRLFLISFLFIGLISFAQEKDYSAFFEPLDTMKVHSKLLYSAVIKQFIKREFTSNYKTNPNLKIADKKKVNICIVIDTLGNVKLFEDNSANKIVSEFMVNCLVKLPKTRPFIDEKGKKNWYALTIVFYLDSEYYTPKQFTVSKDKTIFDKLDKIPRFKKCDKEDDIIKAKECLMSNIQKHIMKNFIYPENAKNKNIQGKTNAFFIIEKDGSIDEITVFDGHPFIQKSTLNIIELLPQFLPGEKNGKKIRVSYTQPISYKLN